MTSDSRLTAAPQLDSGPPRAGADVPDYVGAAGVEVVRPATEPGATAVGIRALARNVSGVVADVVRTGRPAIVTKHGAPFAAIVPIERGTDTALAAAREFLDDMAASDTCTGRTRSSREVFAELARFAEMLSQTAQRERPDGAGRHAGPGDRGDRASPADTRHDHDRSAGPGASGRRGEVGRVGRSHPAADVIPISLA